MLEVLKHSGRRELAPRGAFAIALQKYENSFNLANQNYFI